MTSKEKRANLRLHLRDVIGRRMRSMDETNQCAVLGMLGELVFWRDGGRDGALRNIYDRHEARSRMDAAESGVAPQIAADICADLFETCARKSPSLLEFFEAKKKNKSLKEVVSTLFTTQSPMK